MLFRSAFNIRVANTMHQKHHAPRTTMSCNSVTLFIIYVYRVYVYWKMYKDIKEYKRLFLFDKVILFVFTDAKEKMEERIFIEF